jgi:DNA-binding transcriptional regulator YiaG
MPRNPGLALNLDDPLGRYSTKNPYGYRRLIDPQAGSQRALRNSFFFKAFLEEGPDHERESCTTRNQNQADFLNNSLTTLCPHLTKNFWMSNTLTIHPSKQPRRPHHIEDWAKKRGLSQSELADAIGADKGQVSRWYSGSSPSERWQKKLAAFFGCEPEALFRHPDDDWTARFLEGRSPEEIDRIKDTLKIAFPPPAPLHKKQA